MNRNWMNIASVLVVAALSGCASMSSEECANSDWHSIGYEDGSRGYTTEKFSGRRKACAKHGVTADFQAYQVNDELLAHAPDAWVMHDLPAYRGEEITSEVLDGPRSRIWVQAMDMIKGTARMGQLPGLKSEARATAHPWSIISRPGA